MNSRTLNHEFLEHKIFLQAFAYKLTKDKDLAGDLFQETLYRALKYHEKFKGGNLRAWLATIMRNIFINGKRVSRRVQNFKTDSEKDFIFTSNSQAIHNKGEGTLLMKELLTEVNLLDEDLRVPFMMMHNGYKYNEIAEHLQKPIGTVKSKIHIARKTLIHRLGKLYGEKQPFNMVA